MRVTMRQQISGYRDGQRWPARGEDIDLPDDEAAQLIDQRLAEPAGDRPAEGPKRRGRAGKPDGEQATSTPAGEKR